MEHKGIILSRNLNRKGKFKHLEQEVKIQLFSIEIIIKTIKAIQNNKLTVFDADNVTDNQCQVRTSMTIDAYDFFNLNSNYLDNLYNATLSTKKHMYNFVEKISNSKNYNFIQQINYMLKEFSIGEVMDFYHVIKKTDNMIKNLTLNYLLNPNNDAFSNKTNNFSKDMNKTLKKESQKEICNESVLYLQKISIKFACKTTQKSLNQIEVSPRGLKQCPIYPGIKTILNKVKAQSQPLMIEINKICPACYGITISKKIHGCTKKAGIKIKGYQYTGSLEDTKKALKVPQKDAYIPESSLKPCSCLAPEQPYEVDNIEEVILANAAMHKQFLEDITLKQPTDDFYFYQKIALQKGMCRENMKTLCIRHISPYAPQPTK